MSDTLSALPAGRFGPAGLTRTLRSAWPYLAIIAAALLLWQIGVYALNAALGGVAVSPGERATNFAVILVFKVGMFFFVFWLFRLAALGRDSQGQSVLTYAANKARNDPWRIGRGLIFLGIAALSFVWLQVNFMAFKTAIPDIMPFYLDDAGRQWDRALFFGRDPYTLFGWIYDAPLAVKWIDKIYTYWSAIIAGVWIYCFCSENAPRERRYRYILSMLMLWFVAGNVLALALSSAGPCYYGVFTGDSAAYAPLMARLAEINAIHPLGAFDYQDKLLQMYNTPDMRVGGISAMPSLHVATSLMLLLMFWKNRVLRAVLIAFNIVIYVGSIVLAWHYAVDGLIAAPITLLCWWAAGKITHRIEARLPA